METASLSSPVQSAFASATVLSFGATVLPNSQGVSFRLWAPSAKQVALVYQSTDNQPLPITTLDNGWYELTLPNAKAGELYQFRIDDTLNVPDPASRYQPESVHGWSQIVDAAAFQWKDADWKGRPWEEVSVYELHVGTFTPEGTYKALQGKLDYLQALGITAIELMPLAQCPGSRNWGYDGVLPYAPENCYGTPDELKDLIQAAHARGLMVFLDVVYNHFGPEGNYLHAFAADFFTEKYQTPWGAAIHFEKTQPVRDYFIENSLYWVNEYHFDGLRFDAVHAIQDHSAKPFLQELGERIRASVAPDRIVHLILENEKNQTGWLDGPAHGGFDAQWNDDFHHAMHVLLSGETNGYYADFAPGTSARRPIDYLGRCMSTGFAYQGEPSPFADGVNRGESSGHLPSTAFVDFLQNHDQIGNRAFGDRLSTISKPEAMALAMSTLLLSPSTPMLYMGEEWQSKQPFQFFCDFGPELGPLVTEGRRKEFARFPEFSSEAVRDKIPDPCKLSTFENSKLDWASLETAQAADDAQNAPTTPPGWLKYVSALLHLRQASIVPMLKARNGLIADGTTLASGYDVLSDTAMQVWWELSASETLMFVLNIGPDALTLQPSAFNNALKSGETQVLFESAPAVLNHCQKDQIPGWSAVYVKVPSWKQ